MYLQAEAKNKSSHYGVIKKGEQPMKYEVNINYTTFATHIIEAENETEAILKARQLPIESTSEILRNLDSGARPSTAKEIVKIVTKKAKAAD